MVQNRNWQKRVEDAEARRKESKQRKRKNEDKRLYKKWFQEFLQMLDEHADRMRINDNFIDRDIHVWVDTLPVEMMDLYHSSSAIDDEDYQQGRHLTSKQSKRRLRANSMEVTQQEPSPRKNGRRRANSVSEGKKSTPEITATTTLWLCKSHFYHGTCHESRSSSSSSSKKGLACRCYHYSRPQQKTLHQIVVKSSSSKRAQQEDEVAVAAAAAAATGPVDVVGGVDMVYYVPLQLNAATTTCQEQEESPSLSSQITTALSEKKVNSASIVHMAVGETVVFDRNRQGGQLTSSQDVLLAWVKDTKVVQRKLSIGSEGDGDGSMFELLPGTVLEHMLRFLPDTAVAVASSVCRAWNTEIGKKSPDLWRYLLERRDWPLPPPIDGQQQQQPQEAFQTAFLRHYSVLRDAEAIRCGLAALDSTASSISNSSSRKPLEMGYQDFSMREGAPAAPNECVSVHTWGKNQVLAAYGSDCSLRLFHTTFKSDERGCKELVYQCIDPYRNTIKRKCQMLSMDLDEESIGCLCIVSSDFVPVGYYVLVVVNRDEFLFGETSGVAEAASSSEAHLDVINVGEATLNYILSSEGTDDCAVELLYEIVEFIQDGGDIESVEVLVSPAFTACGYGRFVLEVVISIPGLHDDAEVRQMHLLGRKLVLISAGIGAIVWMGESVSLNSGALPRSETVLLSSVRRPSVTGSLTACSIAVSPEQSPGSIFLLDIEPSGEVFQTQCMRCPAATRAQLEEEGWAPMERSRTMALTSEHVAVADTFEFEDEGSLSRHKVILSFLPRFSLCEESTAKSICLEGMQALQLACVRDNYMVVICRLRKRRSYAVGARLDRQAGYRNEIIAVLVHISSCCEIGRQMWITNHSVATYSRLVMTTDTQETIAVCLGRKGLVMTGCDVRAIGESTDEVNSESPLRSPKSKKKKRKPPKSSRKDAFARGKRMW